MLQRRAVSDNDNNFRRLSSLGDPFFMRSVHWEDEIDRAQSAAEVIVLARDFVASLDDFEIAQLPASCKPRNFASASDITSYAFDLLSYEITTNDGTAKVIFKLAAFFAYASNRLARFHAPSPRLSDEEIRRFVPRSSEK
jgi:hypothetical protein